MDMVWDNVKTHWNDASRKLQAEYSRLTEQDLKDISGDRNRLTQALQDRYELTRDKAEKEIDKFLTNSATWVDKAKQKFVEVADQGVQYVKDHSLSDMSNDLQRLIRQYPIRSALISVGVGWVIAKVGSMTSRCS